MTRDPAGRGTHRSWLVASLAAASATAVAGGVHEVLCPRYQVIATFDSPGCHHFGNASPWSFTDNRYVAGYTTCFVSDDKPYVWLGEDPVIHIPFPPGGVEGRSACVNRDGWVVGEIVVPFGEDSGIHGFVYDGSDTALIPIPEGGTYTTATGVNAHRSVVGYWGNQHGGNPAQVFLWEHGVVTFLADSLSAYQSRSADINDAGQVTGWRMPRPGDERLGFIWQDGETIDLGPIPGGYSSEPKAINEVGDVAGFGDIEDDSSAGFYRRAFLWSKGRMRNLGTLPTYGRSVAYDLNDAAQVVGACSYSDVASSAAFLWSDGVMYDLNDLLGDESVVPTGPVHLSNGRGINNHGEIVASASQGFTVILAPIPPVVGDLDCDRHVGFADLNLLLGAWGACEGCPADLTGDGEVGTADLLMLLAGWG